MPERQRALLIQSFPWGDCTIPKELLAEFGDDEEAQEAGSIGSRKHRKHSRTGGRGASEGRSSACRSAFSRRASRLPKNRSARMKKKMSREEWIMDSIVGQDQKETEEVQSGRGADGNARKKPNSDEHGAEYFR